MFNVDALGMGNITRVMQDLETAGKLDLGLARGALIADQTSKDLTGQKTIWQIVRNHYLVDTDSSKTPLVYRISGYLTIRIHALIHRDSSTPENGEGRCHLTQGGV